MTNNNKEKPLDAIRNNLKTILDNVGGSLAELTLYDKKTRERFTICLEIDAGVDYDDDCEDNYEEEYEDAD